MTQKGSGRNMLEQPRALGEQGEKTRARLMEAAAKVFRERGYSGTRVDDITQSAGTSHGAFYLYFANKQDVLEALAVETADEMYALAGRLEGISHGEDGYDQLRAWIDAFVDSYERHLPVVNAWIAAESEDTRFDRLGREVLSKFAGRISTTIERAVDDGLRHPVHPGTAAVALVAMLERLSYFWLVRGAEFRRYTVVDTVAAIWYESIFGQRAR
ncbi:MAG: TetR/AcrR family transcriptional regulator [Actinomycetota bacterium]